MTVGIGPVEERLRATIRDQGAVHLTLLDPDSQPPQEAVFRAREAVRGGTDGIMVGGSVGAAGDVLSAVVEAIKNEVSVPIILFPGSSAGLCPAADAVFFMSLLNSRSVHYVMGNQALGAPLVRRYGIEPMPMGYIVVEPGGTVGWVGDAKVIPRRKPEIAAAYALAGSYLGMRLIYLEAGSGADSPLPVGMVSMVRAALGNEVILIVGGGIHSGQEAAGLVKAGADVIVTGTAVERSQDVAAFVGQMTAAIKGKR